MITEQRKHPRYRIKNDIVWLFHAGNIGRVKNISSGGCSCICMPKENTSYNPKTISILYSYRGKKLLLENITFGIVHHHYINIGPLSSMLTRNCGVKFEDISSSYNNQIELLISQCGEM